MPREKLRILYNLNHKTAMPFEVELLRRLGFEVFVTRTRFAERDVAMRSAANKDSNWDKHLSIDAESLAFLNEQDFYRPLPIKAMSLVNELFDAVVCIADAQVVNAYVQCFDGLIIVRAYGGDNSFWYSRSFSNQIGPRHFEDVRRLGERFVFAGIFDSIVKAEVAEYRKYAVTLPLGLPASYFDQEKTWVGGSSNVLALAPDVLHSAYYTEVYRNLKRDFLGYSLRIMGQQRIKPEDPAVLGYVSDSEFSSIMSTAAAYLYPSQERRHLHYTPVEAMVTGLPVLFDEEGALSGFFRSKPPGAYSTPKVARHLLDRLLSGDRDLAGAIIRSQSEVLEKMGIDWAYEQWRRVFDRELFGVLESIRARKVETKTGNQQLSIPYRVSGFDWLHSFNIAPHLVVQGHASLDEVKERGDALLGGVDVFNKTVLEIGEGEGAYAVRMIRAGCKKVITLCVNDDQLLKCQMVRDSLVLPAWELRRVGIEDLVGHIRTSSTTADWVIAHGISNYCLDVKRLLRTLAACAHEGLVLEFWSGLREHVSRAVTIAKPSELKAGFPPVWFGSELAKALTARPELDEVEVFHTPGSPGRRVLRRRARRAKDGEILGAVSTGKKLSWFRRVHNTMAKVVRST
jgi:hypothetical protein